MKALIDTSNNNKVVIEKVTNSRILLNELYSKNEAYQVTFYKKLYGFMTEVATVTFIYPYTVTLRYTRLSVAEQKQFIAFITDHLSTNLYCSPYNLEFLD